MAWTAALLAAPTVGLAQEVVPASRLDEVVVTASRTGRAVDVGRLGSSVTVVDAAAMEQRQVRIVSDVLRDIPSVSVSRSGSVGGLTQVRIRGSEGNHVLMLVDGIEASDPSQGEFDFATLFADEGARIEVLRGQQSALYGSDAIGGVIQYITASGRERPGLSGRFEAGSLKTAQGALRYGGVHGPFDFAVSGSYYTTDGVPNSRFGVRDLDAKNNTLSGKATFAPVDNFRVIAVARYAETSADTNNSNYSSPSSDPSYGLPVDSTNFYYNRQRMGLVRAEGEVLDGRWTHALTAQMNRTQRRSFTDVGRPGSFSNGAREKYSYDTSFRFETGEVTHTLTGAVDRELESYRNLPLTAVVTAQNARRRINNTGLVGQYDLDWQGRLILGGALRRDENSAFQDITTYRLQGSYLFDTGTRVRAASGSGIKNPTFTELYGFNPATFIGNPNLKAETSKGWEAGLEQTLLDGQLRVGATYFDARLDNEIYTVFTPSFVSTPANRTTRSKQRGVELTLEAKFGKQWRIDGAYTHLDAVENGVKEIRRPDNMASLNFAWRDLSDRFGATATIRYNGRMTDNYFGATTQTKILPAFTLVNFDADWKISRNFQLYGRIENLLDKDYEEVYGYRTQGRAAYVGIRATL